MQAGPMQTEASEGAQLQARIETAEARAVAADERFEQAEDLRRGACAVREQRPAR